jgi:RNA polymerase sigma-70 factor (ECF subfamily)
VDELTELLLAARSGDRMAFGAFVRAAQADVWRLSSQLVGRTDADDVTQEVFLRAWRSRAGFRGDASARTWILSIARRACADAVRHKVRRRRATERAAPTGGHDERATDPATRSSLSDLLDHLATDQREAFVLTQVVGCSYEEAAAACGVPVGTIRSRVARAREELVRAVRLSRAV